MTVSAFPLVAVISVSRRSLAAGCSSGDEEEEGEGTIVRVVAAEVMSLNEVAEEEPERLAAAAGTAAEVIR